MTKIYFQKANFFGLFLNFKKDFLTYNRNGRKPVYRAYFKNSLIM